MMIQLNNERFKEDNIKDILLKKFGFSESTDEGKQTHKMENLMDKHLPKDIDHYISEHAMLLQNSRYVTIEHSREDLKKNFKKRKTVL